MSPHTDHGAGYLYEALYDRSWSWDACMNVSSEPPHFRATKKQTRSLSRTSQQRWTEQSLKSMVSHSHVVIPFQVFPIFCPVKHWDKRTLTGSLPCHRVTWPISRALLDGRGGDTDVPTDFTTEPLKSHRKESLWCVPAVVAMVLCLCILS